MAVEMASAAAKVLLAVKVALVLGVATAATMEVALMPASTTEAAEALVVEGVAEGEEDLVGLLALDT